jgi:hypothetical protein
VLTKDEICTLVDVVITDPTQADLFHQSHTTRKFVASEITKAKEKNYHD